MPIWQSQSQESRSANERGVLGGVKLSEPGCAYMAKPGQQWGEGKLIHNRVCLYDRAGAKVRGGKGVPSWLGEAQMGGRG